MSDAHYLQGIFVVTLSISTVKILTGTVKRTATAPPSSKTLPTPSKRSQLNDAAMMVTHTGSPVNPVTAKALATKLSERNSNNIAVSNCVSSSSSTVIDVLKVQTVSGPSSIPPLVTIQMPVLQSGELELSQQVIDSPLPSNFDSSLPAFNIFKNEPMEFVKEELIALPTFQPEPLDEGKVRSDGI